MSFLNFLLWTIPFWVPAIVGVYLLINKSDEKLTLLAALLTLKPILTTPLWYAAMGGISSPITRFEPAQFYSILPGASLTLAAVAVFHSLFFGANSNRGWAWGLIFLDSLRWINSFLYVSPVGAFGDGALACLFALTGLALPTIFAVVALTTSFTLSQDGNWRDDVV